MTSYKEAVGAHALPKGLYRHTSVTCPDTIIDGESSYIGKFSSSTSASYIVSFQNVTDSPGFHSPQLWKVYIAVYICLK